ncbi:MAG: dockerin type I domain-containing protein [Tepidisphaerales bacterium]
MRYTRLTRRALAGVLTLFAGQALAADYHWNNSDAVTGGDFLTPSNWLVGGTTPVLPPGAGDAAWLDLAGEAPLITLAAPATNKRLIVESSSPMVQSGAVTYTLSSPLGSDASVVVGGTTAASLTFTGRLTSNEAVIGQAATGQGIMTLAADALGAGAIWTSIGPVTVGQAGAASLYVNDGSILTCPQLSAGFASSATGSVFAGTAATLTVAGLMTIGTDGQATLDIEDGAQVKADTAVFALHAPASPDITGDLDMGLAGSLQVTNGLYLGLNGTTSGDIVGASIQAGSLAIGGCLTGAYTGNGTGSISLTGSNATVATRLQVGAGGNGTLQLLQGATLTSQSAVVGDAPALLVAAAAGVESPGTGAVYLEGGTTWTNTGDLFVGYGPGGNGTVMVVQGSGDAPAVLATGTQAAPSQAAIGYNGTGSVTVSDSGSVWTHHGGMYVGKLAGSTGMLSVADGGQVVTDNLYVASDGGLNGGTGDVSVSGTGADGAPARLIVNNSVVVGTGDTGVGSVTVMVGGAMQVAGSLSVATGSALSSGSVTVADPGSALSVTGAVNVGVDGGGSFAVQNGAAVTTGNVFIGKGPTASGCAATVADGGQWTSTGGFYVGGDSTGPRGGGSLTVDGSTSPATVTAAGPITIWSSGSLVVNNATLVVPSIELNGGIVAGQGVIPVPVNTTGGEFQVDVPSLELSNALTSAADSTMSKTGAGALVISGPQSHGPATSMLVQEGELRLLSDAGSAAAANLKVDVAAPGSAVFATTQHLRELSVGAGATATVSKDANATLIVHGLSIDATGATPGAVDLQNNDLVWAYGPQASPYAQVKQWILSGSAGHGGLVTGALSPSPGFAVALAPVDNTQLHLLTWNGQTVSDGTDFKEILVKYTYLGDVNLDGKVDARDLQNVVAHMNQPGSWFDGDVDLDGMVTIADYNIVLAQMNAGNGAGGGQPLLTPWTAAADSPLLVPEPGALGMLAMAVGGLLVRRRKYDHKDRQEDGRFISQSRTPVSVAGDPH